MKKMSACLLILCVFTVNSEAQVPNQFNYQAVARNSQGQSIPNATIRTRFTILDGSATGANVYSEVRLLTTNQLGLFTAAIGGTGAASVTGNFATIDWSTGKKFIKVEVDPLGGTNFLAIGNTEMLSVPYALYAVNGRVGPAGPPNVLNIGTVTTGATGTSASATITGTAPAQTINLVLPTGANGKISLVKTSTEPVGANCSAGGTKIEAGVDNNGNSTLDAAEVTNISYVCNGDVAGSWKTTGNSGTTASNFIGTTDVKPLIVKTNNTEALRIDSAGNVGIGTNVPGTKLAVISSSTQPLVNVSNTGSGPLSFGINAASQNGVGIYGISQNGRAVVGFNNNTTQPTAEFTNASSGPGVKVATSSLNSPTAQFINSNIYGTAVELQGGMYAPGALTGFNLVPLGVVTYDFSFATGTSGDYDASFINKAGALVLSAQGHYESQSFGAPDYMYCDLFLDVAKTLPYTEIIAVNTPNFDGEGPGLSGNALITRIWSKIMPAASAGNPQKKYRVEIGVDDFGNVAPPIETGTMGGVVIFYGLK
jgi:hypothetical protein